MDSKLKFDFTTTQKIINKIGYIDSFKGKWKTIEKHENKYLKELRRIATIQSIGSSTRIEGATLTNQEVETLLNNLKITKLESREEQEVVGYFEVLEIILNDWKSIDLNHSNIFNLHNLLLKFSNKDQNHRGQYKQVANKIVAKYPDGKQRVIFNTTEPYLVKKEMDNLLIWTNKNIQNSAIHPLIIVATFIYEFLSIHPFQDGNGRLSRLLTTLLLLKQGYDFMQYISFENQIELRKQEYYRALMNAQQHRYGAKEIIDDWMIFFLENIEVLIEKLEVKYQQFKEKGPYLNQRQKMILGFIKENEPIKISDLATHFKQQSKNTLKKDMQYLTREGVIEKLGETKGTIYVIKGFSKK
ncbi:MAG: Fic family protein [Saprospiraceae bacterium]|jgi:Fic family protein|nr:Fic family protein [Saprospiraceae bacterium]